MIQIKTLFLFQGNPHIHGDNDNFIDDDNDIDQFDLKQKLQFSS